MKIHAALLPMALIFLMVPNSPGQKKHRPMTGSAAKGSISASMQAAPNLSQRLAKWRRVRMPFQSKGLSARELKMVNKLVDASAYLEAIFWRQSDPDALTLYQSLASSRNAKDQQLRRYLWINGARFDLLDGNRPFVGGTPMPAGRGFYPQGLERGQLEDYVKDHPEKKQEIYSPYTLIRWKDKELEALPYHIAYRSFLEPAAKDLREAAELSSDPGFAKFLRLRADALLTDNYFDSDLAWLDLKDPKFDVIFAPYETYLDSLLGVKTSYGAAVLIRNTAESKKLALFQKYVPDLQDALPLALEDRPSKRGLESPMEVMDSPYRAGDLTHGYQAVADNLPNDARIHEQKGSKKIFFKNFMDARVQYVVLPIAKRLMPAQQAAQVSDEGYFLSTLLHEMAHGMGPAFSRAASGKVDIRQAIGPVFNALEEAKADAVGMWGLKWLVEQGALPQNQLKGYYASYVAELLRAARFGIGEAHGQAEVGEFNYLIENRAILRKSGRYAVDYSRMPAAVEGLMKELLTIEATGDKQRAEDWVKKYGSITPELQQALNSVADVPVDVDPVFAMRKEVQ
jgi:hypothetical protein